MHTDFRALGLSTIAAVLIAFPSFAASKEVEKTAHTILTVYVSAHTGRGIAKKVNESHLKMEEQGWRFVDLDIHVENNDTEGAWITYVK